MERSHYVGDRCRDKETSRVPAKFPVVSLTLTLIDAVKVLGGVLDSLFR